MKEQLIELITARLHQAREEMQEEFNRPQKIKVARHFALDNLLPPSIAQTLYEHFPKPRHMHLILMRVNKIKIQSFKRRASLLRDINSAIQDPQVVAQIEQITGIQNKYPTPPALPEELAP